MYFKGEGNISELIPYITLKNILLSDYSARDESVSAPPPLIMESAPQKNPELTALDVAVINICIEPSGQAIFSRQYLLHLKTT